MYQFGLLIKSADKLIKRKFDQNLENVGLTFSQMRVLKFLEQNSNRKVTQKDISIELDIKHSTTIGLLKRMGEKGLVEVVKDNDNKRYRNIYLTKKADDIKNEMEKHRENIEACITKSFSDEEKEMLNELLNRVIDNLK